MLFRSRIKNNPQRPIAFNSTKSELLNLIKKRSNIYLKALYTINCDGLTKKQIVDKILVVYAGEAKIFGSRDEVLKKLQNMDGIKG